jgi:hypothetical protein
MRLLHLIANKLSLNVAKTEFNFMLIGSKPMIKKISESHPNVFIENKQIIKDVYESTQFLVFPISICVDQHGKCFKFVNYNISGI